MGVPFAVYDTQGIPVLRSKTEGIRVPTFEDLGIDYGDMDTLGVWLAIRRRRDKTIIGMRIDHIFEGEFGRDNRYILIIELGMDKLDDFTTKFRATVEKILMALEDAQNAIYRGKDGGTPFIDPGVVDKIVELIDEVPKYPPEVLKEFGLSPERLRVRVDGLDYDDPGIGDREAALKLMVDVLKRRPNSPLTELVVFSKSSSSKYNGLWIEKNAKTPDELISIFNNLFSEMSRKLEECSRDRDRYREEASKYKKRYEEYYAEARRLKSRSKGIALPIAIGAMIALLIGGFIVGAYLQSSGVLPLFGKPVKVTHVKDVELEKLLLNVSSIPNESSRKVLREYVGFINTSQRTDIVNFPQLADVVRKDIAVHRAYSERVDNLTRTVESQSRTIGELNNITGNLAKELSLVEFNLRALNSTIATFGSETHYFVLMCGTNVTLTQEDLRVLKTKPGIDGWTLVMRRHCLSKLNDTKVAVLNSTAGELNLLTGNGGTIPTLTATRETLLKIRNSSITTDENALGNLSLFIGSVDDSIKEAQKVVESWKAFNKGVIEESSKAGSCEVAYNYETAWKDRLKTLRAQTVANLSNTSVMADIASLYALANSGQDYTYEEIKDMNGVPASVKGLVYYVASTEARTGFTTTDFWRLIRTTITSPPDTTSLEGINQALDELNQFVSLLAERLGVT